MTAMRVVLTSTIIVIILALGCGYNPDKPVYDTSRNPEGYPAPALALVNQLEAGTLHTYDAITNAFAQLYEGHPELLDNQQWLQVISRMGVKFRFQADKLAEQGIPKYHQAAQLYTLAAFARPDDERLQHRDALFRSWERAIADSVVAADFKLETQAPGLPQQLKMLRYFVLSDSTSRQFAQEFLIPQMLDSKSAESALKTSSSLMGLTTADKCFLRTLDFKYAGPDQVLTSFSEPAIDLVATRVTAEQSGWYSAELYFIPRETVMVDYTVALRVATPDTTRANTVNWVTFDFHPVEATSNWKVGEIAPAYRRFMFSRPISSVAVGLMQLSADSAHFVRLRDTGESLFMLPATTFADR